MSGVNMPKWFAVLVLIIGCAWTIVTSEWFWIALVGIFGAYCFWS